MARNFSFWSTAWGRTGVAVFLTRAGAARKGAARAAATGGGTAGEGEAAAATACATALGWKRARISEIVQRCCGTHHRHCREILREGSGRGFGTGGAAWD